MQRAMSKILVHNKRENLLLLVLWQMFPLVIVVVTALYCHSLSWFVLITKEVHGFVLIFF